MIASAWVVISGMALAAASDPAVPPGWCVVPYPSPSAPGAPAVPDTSPAAAVPAATPAPVAAPLPTQVAAALPAQVAAPPAQVAAPPATAPAQPPSSAQVRWIVPPPPAGAAAATAAAPATAAAAPAPATAAVPPGSASAAVIAVPPATTAVAVQAMAVPEAAPPDAAVEDDAEVTPAPEPTWLGPRLSEGRAILLARIERGPNRAVERLLEPNGEIVIHEVEKATGLVQSCEPVGSIHRLRVLEQRPGPGGAVMQVVRDDSGALLRFYVGRDGEPRGVSVFAPAPPPLGIYAGSAGP